jgi:hypothetical protein
VGLRRACAAIRSRDDELSAALFDERTHLMRAGASEALAKWNLSA